MIGASLKLSMAFAGILGMAFLLDEKELYGSFAIFCCFAMRILQIRYESRRGSD